MPDLAALDVRRHILYKRDGERTLAVAVAERMLEQLEQQPGAAYYELWRAATWPPPPRLVFHTAPAFERDSIRQAGLRMSQPGTGWWRPRPGCVDVQSRQPVGVYVGSEPDRRGKWAHWPAWDIWQIDADGLPWRPDELNPGYWSIAVDIIDPGRLHLFEEMP